MPQRFANLFPCAQVEAMERAEADQSKQSEQQQSTNLELGWLGHVDRDHADTESQTDCPNCQERHPHSEQLVMDQLVVLVDFEDKRVVNPVRPKNVDVGSCREHHPDKHEREYKGVFTRKE